MIVGIGLDVCDIGRWREMVARRPRAVERLLTPAEAQLNHTSQAARFAAKEALAKALGAPGGLGWQDAEVVVDDLGRPAFRLSGTVAARAAELGVTHVHLSITHDSGIASAFVVCEAS
ncbi:MAG TPA: holo-ACP synthase [Propionibacteriaceae bacterium]|nr:holo-ACP synthase [Propionibacteriaceae bacterium]